MQVRLALLLTFLGTALARKLGLDTNAGDRPVTKVVKLLQGMYDQLEKEAKEESELMEKYECWCKENGADKAASVAEFEKKLKQMEAKVAELSATSSRLKVEYTNLGKDVKKDEAEMDGEMEVRRKEVGEFDKDKSDLLQLIEKIQNARSTVSKTGGQFVQVSVSHRKKLRSLLQSMITKHSDKLDEKTVQSIASLLQEADPTTDLLLGKLQGMENTYNMTLSELEAEEAKAKAKYEKFIKAKREVIDTSKIQIATKKEQKSAADEEMTHTKQDIEDGKESMGADIAFAAEVKEKCGSKAKEWEKRQKTRAQEIEAVAKAIKVLSSDDAQENFGKTMSFLQVESTDDAVRRQMVSKTLARVGEKHDARLVTLAMEAKLDGFTRVKDKIDLMVSALKKEQADEVTKKNWCTEELQANRLQKDKKARKVKALQAKKEELTLNLEEATETITTLEAEVKEMKKQQKLAAQVREKENAEFQKNVQEQRQTQVLLKKAMSVLGGFYNKKEALIQNSEIPKEPKTFGGYKKSSSANGVMLMLQQLIADAEAMETESVAGEQESQSDYEAFGKKTNEDLETKSKSMADKADEKAKAEKNLVETRETKEGVDAEIESLETTNFSLHEDCDFTMQNFDARQKARSEEVEALAQAKAYLSGAKLIQRS